MPGANNWPFIAATPDISHLERRVGLQASLGSVTLLVAPTPDMYAVDVYAEVTTASAAGTVAAFVNYTDSTGAAQQTTATLILTVAGITAHLSARLCFWLASGDVTFGTTVAGLIGTPTYNVTARAERCWSSL